MSNTISFIANVVADAEVSQAGQSDVMKVRLANNVGFGDKKTTNWFTAELWGKRGVSLQPHLVKGKQVFVTGSLTLRKYNDKEGVEKISPDVKVSDIQMVGSKDSSPASSPASQTTSSASAGTEDDMPF